MYKINTRDHKPTGAAKYKRAVQLVEVTSDVIAQVRESKRGESVSLTDIKILIREGVKREKILREFPPTDHEIDLASRKAAAVLREWLGGMAGR